LRDLLTELGGVNTAIDLELEEPVPPGARERRLEVD
jgi:hypothetical protein